MEIKEIFIQTFKDFTPEQIVQIARAMGTCEQMEEYATCSSIDEMLEQASVIHLAWFMRPYLTGAPLRGADLRDVALLNANMSEADLRGADMRGADLRGADMRDAKLRNAHLRNADMRGADLRGADMRDATLHNADLREAVGLSEGQREYAALRGAIL
jgi:uncharacterized protein YjbI with pentapeptide repeats